MSVAAIKLYNILIDKGVDRDLAQEAVDEFLTKEEARLLLATKEDVANIREDLRKQIMWVAGMMIGQIAIITGVMALLLDLI